MLHVKNWDKFQHYRDRCPPWIKLATDTFQNLEFSRLHGASKLLAICIWTLASRSKDGSIPDDFDYICQWGFLSGYATKKNLDELINQGFIERDSNMLANCKQSARPETETEGETETEESHIFACANKTKTQGSRIPDSFSISEAVRRWAGEKGMPSPDDHIEAFVDYWRAKSGAGAVKLDWDATFRTWLRNARNTKTWGGNGNGKSRSAATVEAIFGRSINPVV